MRIVIYGVGAVGGTLAVMLTKAGHEVIGIARGRQLEAIQQNGLLLRTPDGDHHARFACLADPSEIAFRPDDVVLLTMKTQDTPAALDRLRAAGVEQQAVFCFQNGVSNEDFALRLFPNVYGVVVEMPTTFTIPGEIGDFFTPKLGIFDIGRYGVGNSETGTKLAAILDSAGFSAFYQADIKPWKYAKLLMNLGNAIDTAIGDAKARQPYVDAARKEAHAVFAAAGIVPADMKREERLALATLGDIQGVARVVSSSAQSLARGAGSIETDYLNGEIVLLGRKLGVPTPVNAYFASLTQAMMRQNRPVGSVPLDEIAKALPTIPA